jgi:hypothetical protein
MLLDSFSRLVNTETNDLDFASPICFPLFQHFLVVGHWTLAWWAPCCPKVNHPNLTSLVNKINWIASLDRYNLLDGIILTSWSELDTYINLQTFALEPLNFALERINIFLQIRSQRSFDFNRECVLNFSGS